MNKMNKEPMGKMVLSRQLFEDCDRIDLMQEKIEVARAYFEAVKMEKPEGLVVKKFAFNLYGKAVYPSGMVAIGVGRKRYLAMYSKDLNTLGYVELQGVEG